MLFLLAHETQQREIRLNLGDLISPRESVYVVQAGDLTVRQTCQDSQVEATKGTNYLETLVCNHESISPRLVADLECAACERFSHSEKKYGVWQHLREAAFASASVILGLCCLGGVLAVCSFLIGVALPFRLLSFL